MKKKQLVRFDWAIKKILRQKANFKVLEGFISCILNRDIRIKQILESESNQDLEHQKYNRVDILCLDEDKELIIVEVQVEYQLDYLQRMLFSSSRLVTEYLHTGQKYGEIHKIYSINILYFDPGTGKDYVYRGNTEFRGLHTQEKLSLNPTQQSKFAPAKDASDLYPEYWLISVERFNETAKVPLDEWIYFLKNEKVESHFTAPGLSEALTALDILKLSSRNRQDYNRYMNRLRDEASRADTQQTLREEAWADGMQRGMQRGMQQGIEIGIEKGKLTSIFELYQEGVLDNATAHKKIEAFFGRGFDELVQFYLSQLS
ncbi:MAG: Rpn family recombination-promoting nuclease/putative transposase [Candidatus Cloacimonetes bacterium]|nr:Rpn family recombination-promoting nuclease/putative transposase [Candidatus Cloacimonadota bacterium]